jgi:hypothetical protein
MNSWQYDDNATSG